MAAYTQVYSAVTGDTLTASIWNAEFAAVAASVNSITNAQVNASAGITYSKLSLTGGIVNADISASAAIAVSKIATGLTGSLVGTTDTQTITNKTLTGPTITGPTITGTIGGNPTVTKPTINGSIQAYTSDSDGATITFDMSASNVHTVTLGGNRTLAVANVSAGQAFVIRLVQDGTGSRTVTFFSTIKWPGGSAPTLTTTAAKTDIFGFLCTSTGNYDGYIIGMNL